MVGGARTSWVARGWMGGLDGRVGLGLEGAAVGEGAPFSS